MPKIRNFSGRKILNSKGHWTIEVMVELDNGHSSTAAVPQGVSFGSYEAISVAPKIAISNLRHRVTPALRGVSVEKQQQIDKLLIKLDGTAQKKKLGANTILGVSLACARAQAWEKQVPLWQYLRQLFLPLKARFSKPRLVINLLEGGLHAGNGLDFQEYLIIPRTTNFTAAIRIGTRVYQELREFLQKTKGPTATGLGDEGGFAPRFKNNLEPFTILKRIVKKLKLARDVDFGLDAAASNLKIPPAKLFSIYKQMITTVPLSYLEDPFGENDFENFTALFQKFGKRLWLVGDDLTTTNPERMAIAYAKNSINAVIIKPNQIGTLTETLTAVRRARAWGWQVIVSHRGGETNDDFIADLAFATSADGFKLGAPARGERIAKYNRLLEIEGETA